MRRWIVIFSITALISACSVLSGDSGNTAQPAEETTNNEASSLVSWERDPLEIVFQADVIGSSLYGTFIDNNRIPLCTIYGDGRLVWLSDDNNQVLFDFVTDKQIEDFVTYLTLDERFYTFNSGLETLFPSAEFPLTEIVKLNVNGIEHRSDSFGDWTDGYFQRLLNNCISLSQQPRIFQPSEGWMSIEFSSYTPSIASIPWEAEATGLNLDDVIEMPSSSIWLEERLVLPIWTAIRENGGRVQLSQLGTDYLVVLRVPGVTYNAPPPPTEANPTLELDESDT